MFPISLSTAPRPFLRTSDTTRPDCLPVSPIFRPRRSGIATSNHLALWCRHEVEDRHSHPRHRRGGGSPGRDGNILCCGPVCGGGATHRAARDAGIGRAGRLPCQLGDCAACHSIPGKPPYSGGLRMVTPIGAIYTTNITPDPTYGIGRFSLADFDRALRFGVAEGHTLYPAMPFTSYYNTTPEDIAALYAYFQQGVPAAVVSNGPSDIPFPLSMRWPLTYWRWLFAPKPTPFQPLAAADAEVARGAYFVEGLGHCGECHTPRAVTMQLKATTPKDGSAYLSGAVIENYFAPSLRNGGTGTLGDWSVEELAQFLKSGASSKGIAFGSMSDVIIHSTQYMSDADALAAAKYLKSIRNA